MKLILPALLFICGVALSRAQSDKIQASFKDSISKFLKKIEDIKRNTGKISSETTDDNNVSNQDYSFEDDSHDENNAEEESDYDEEENKDKEEYKNMKNTISLRCIVMNIKMSYSTI